jgi:hypothetical protein
MDQSRLWALACKGRSFNSLELKNLVWMGETRRRRLQSLNFGQNLTCSFLVSKDVAVVKVVEETACCLLYCSAHY